MMRVGILTISDRAARGEADDASGPLIRGQVIERLPAVVIEESIIPDERYLIEEILRRWSDEADLDLILTTGGTGFAPRDVTPEATRSVIERDAPGMAEAMRAAGLRATPYAMLSRAVAGIRGRTLIVNLPGSPKAARENLDVILPALPHGLALLKDVPGENRRHTADAGAAQQPSWTDDFHDWLAERKADNKPPAES
jgi:molybdenum cofactor synthesis domain-containing protein